MSFVIRLVGENTVQPYLNRIHSWRQNSPPKKLTDNPQGFTLQGSAKWGVVCSYYNVNWDFSVKKLEEHFVLTSFFRHGPISKDTCPVHQVSATSHPIFYRELSTHWEAAKLLYVEACEEEIDRIIDRFKVLHDSTELEISKLQRNLQAKHQQSLAECEYIQKKLEEFR